jgi:hypothetical protein
VPFKTFTTGEVLTAVNVNDYLMEQAVISCTSGTRPSSPNEGMAIYETDTDSLVIYNGSAWVAAVTHQGWTDYSGSLAWTASGTNPDIGNGSFSSAYARYGRTIIYRGRITMGSTTTYGTGSWLVSLPVDAQATVEVGTAAVFDNSTSTNNQPAAVRVSTAPLANFYATGGTISATVPITWADSDNLRWCLTYSAGA